MRVSGLRYDKPGAILEGFEAVRCEFQHVSLGATKTNEPPVIVRHCRLERCRIRQAYLDFVQIEDCVVDGMSGGMVRLTEGPLLKHVVVKGSVESTYLRYPRLGYNPAVLERRRVFYGGVDWALDISQAKLRRCEIGGVPGPLVRRDPATQILVTRERVLVGPWEEAAADTAEYFSIRRLLEPGLDSIVLVACPRGDNFEKTLTTFARLRKAGIAEPD
jgi:hypothetical protein